MHLVGFGCSEADLQDQEDLYDQVYIEDEDEIYDDLCSLRKRRSRLTELVGTNNSKQSLLILQDEREVHIF